MRFEDQFLSWKRVVAAVGMLFMASMSFAQTWSLLAPNGPLPVARDIAMSVYSPASNRLIVFGGYPHVTAYRNDLWMLNSANGIGAPTWT